MRALFGMLVFLVFLTSCSKTSLEKKREEEQKNVLLSHLKQQDVPVPVGFIPYAKKTKDKESKVTTMICYRGNLSVKQSIHFYRQSMELDGWNIEDFSTDESSGGMMPHVCVPPTEGLLFCRKSNKQCAISVRENQNKIDKCKTNLRVLLQHEKHSSVPEDQANTESCQVKHAHFITPLNPDYADTINKKEINV